MSMWEVMSGKKLDTNVCWKLEKYFPFIRDVFLRRNLPTRSDNYTLLMNFGSRSCVMISWSGGRRLES